MGFGPSDPWGPVGRKDKGQGARLPKKPTHKLDPVFQEIKKWYTRERQHGHEIKRHHIRMRFQVQLETEIGRQRVLDEHSSPKFDPQLLSECQGRLQRMMDQLYMSRQGLEWERTILFPAIGAHARKGTRLTHLKQEFDPALARLTWASIDHCIYQTLHGTPEDLQRWVCDPHTFQLNASELPILGFDQTPVRLELW